MGTPAYAVPILRALMDEFQVISVVTQPDQPVGRGKHIQAPPVKLEAQKYGLPVLQPEKIRTEVFHQELVSLNPDMIVVAAYGKILPKSILEFPRYGCLNVHASVLPRWRGAAPIHSAILYGDTTSGASIMLMDEGVDTGPLLATAEVTIDASDTSADLSAKIAMVGADLLVKAIPAYVKGELTPKLQVEQNATYTKLMKKEDGRLDFRQEAKYLERQVRACNPWPIGFFKWDRQALRVWKAAVLPTRNLEIGRCGIRDRYPCVGTDSTDLKLLEVQPEGKRVMSGLDFLNGVRDWASKTVTETEEGGIRES